MELERRCGHVLRLKCGADRDGRLVGLVVFKLADLCISASLLPYCKPQQAEVLPIRSAVRGGGKNRYIVIS